MHGLPIFKTFNAGHYPRIKNLQPSFAIILEPKIFLISYSNVTIANDAIVLDSGIDNL